MTILVIDGQGGKLGRQLVKAIAERFPRADIIVGPVGIVVADSLMGEVTPAMATAVGQSRAVRILVPINRCETLIAGVSGVPASRLLEDAMDKIQGVLEGKL